MYVWGIFDIAVFNVILGSFGVFDPKLPVHVFQKRLALEQNRLKFGTWGY